MTERSPEETIRAALEAVIYQVPGWSGPDPWFKPNVEAALEALAVLGRQVREYDAEASRAVLARQEAERQLAEKDEALRSILDVTTGWSAKMSASTQLLAIARIAREALRAEGQS